jgi:hypothetical protein
VSAIIQKRVCAEIEGPFVVFLIGMRINRWWKVASWLPVLAAMPRMLKELAAQSDSGLLAVRSIVGLSDNVIIQYWRSFEHLEAYARHAEYAHLPAWQAFNRSIGSNGDVGIWHETYLVQPGGYESFYNSMPRIGLGLAGKLADAQGARKSAHQRIKATADASQNDGAAG